MAKKGNKQNKSQMLMQVNLLMSSGHWEAIRMSTSESDSLMSDWHAKKLPEFVEGIWVKDSCQKSILSAHIIGITVKPYIE
jgi:hypothetical protein